MPQVITPVPGTLIVSHMTMHNSEPGSSLDRLKIGLVLVLALSFIASIVFGLVGAFKTFNAANTQSGTSISSHTLRVARFIINVGIGCRIICVICVASLLAVAIYEDYVKKHPIN
jgi:hypothetical protein